MTKTETKRKIVKEMGKPKWNPDKINLYLNQLDLATEDIDVPLQDMMFFSARVCNTTIRGVRSASRLRRNVVARNLCIRQLRSMGYTLVGIGELFNRNHSSVMHSLNTIEMDIRFDEYAKTASNKFDKLLELE